MGTLDEVARRAGVSKMSVSRVVNNSPRVAPRTRARVLEAMEALNYSPNVAARTLKHGRSASIGVLFPASDNPIYSRYAAGIVDTAYAAGHSVILCRARSGLTGEEENSEDIRLLRDQRVPGVILTGAWNTHLPALLRGDFQVVTIDARVPGCDRVTLDNAEAMRRAVQHLAGLGHRSIGAIAGPFMAHGDPERLIGFRRAMRAASLPLERRWQIVAHAFTDEQGIAATNALLRSGARPTALVVTSSALMPGVLIALGAAHLRVPEDIAIIGVGEMSWTPALVSPITSLVEPAYQMGVDGCRLLLERINGGAAELPRRIVHAPHLAVRLSCGAPPAMRDVPLNSPQSLLFYAGALAWSAWTDDQTQQASPRDAAGVGGRP